MPVNVYNVCWFTDGLIDTAGFMFSLFGLIGDVFQSNEDILLQMSENEMGLESLKDLIISYITSELILLSHRSKFIIKDPFISIGYLTHAFFILKVSNVY